MVYGIYNELVFMVVMFTNTHSVNGGPNLQFLMAMLNYHSWFLWLYIAVYDIYDQWLYSHMQRQPFWRRLGTELLRQLLSHCRPALGREILGLQSDLLRPNVSQEKNMYICICMYIYVYIYIYIYVCMYIYICLFKCI